jgi:dTDP-4-dehydrorhamnose 3,5-epimerase
MEIELLGIEGPKVFKGVRHFDSRGYFSEIYETRRFMAAGLPKFVQDNLSKSKAGVFRGLHWQAPPFEQGKLVTCLNGSIIDFIVDIRLGSPTFLSALAVPLDASHLKSLWVPPGFAHGFLSLENETLVHYKVTNHWDGASERSLSPQILSGVSPVDLGTLEISQKDMEAPMLLPDDYRDFSV